MLPPRFYDPLLPFAPSIDRVLDPLVVRLGRTLIEHWKGPPFRHQHAQTRALALEEATARWRPRVESIWGGVRAKDPTALARYDDLLKSAVEDLRGAAEARAALTPLQRGAHSLDRVLYANSEEWLDDPSFDLSLRVRSLERLDRLNEALGSYDAFHALIAPHVDRARAAGVARPVVVDLASGHAMFAVDLALRLGARRGEVRVVATDLVGEFLEVGRARARALAMTDDAITFLEQDALDLRPLEGRIGAPIDVICCTQSLHHFPPGLVARLLAEAVATARHGVSFIDGERNAFALVLVAALATALGRGSLPFLHDAVVSLRRMYTEQELALIARLAPAADGVGIVSEAGWRAPGFAWVDGAGRWTPPPPRC